MIRFPVLLFAAVAMTSAPAFAHADHDEMRAPATPEQEARGSVMRMISQAKLPASWSKAKLVESKGRVRNGANQTVVSFRNDAESTKARKMLYVVVANGSVVSTGHTLK